MKLSLALLLLLAPLMSHAAGTISAKQTGSEPKMPGLFRVGILASGMTGPEGSYENNENPKKNSASATIFTAIGRGAVSFEAGVSYVTMADIVTHTSADSSKHDYLVNTSYVGVPLLLKYNYIERPLAAFYVKGGAMPIRVQEQSTGTDRVVVSGENVLGIVGIGGSTELSDSVAFILDVSYFQKTNLKSTDGLQDSGATLGVGLSYDL